MTDFELLKGTRDYERCEQLKINKVLDIIKKNFESYGFSPLDTPLIEMLATLTNKYDEDAEIVQEIFKLSDRGNRELGLRYDLTVPLCRYVATKRQLKLPFKRYAIGKVFRDGPIKVGRLREFMQCDADVVGVGGVEIEAETLKMFYSTYSELGIDSVIEINNNKILRGAFLQNGFSDSDLGSLVLSVDKLKKIGIDGVLDEIVSNGFDKNSAKAAIEILNSSDFKEIESLAKSDVLKDGINELSNLVSLLSSLGVEYRVNFSMSRGLAIYTGNIWEAYDKSGKVTSSIGSGGRYDTAISNFSDGKVDLPAFGVSFGLIPILACLGDEFSEGVSLTEILVAPLKENLLGAGLKVAEALRAEGKRVEVCYDCKLKKAFNYSEFIGCDEIVILGEKDLGAGEYTIKNLKSKEERKVSFGF